MSEFATVDRRFWRTQLPVDYLDTTLVINTWETVSADLSGGLPAKLWFIVMVQTNNGATAETIELEITINGVAHTFTFSGIGSATPGYGYYNADLSAGTWKTQATTTIITVGSIESDAAVPFIAESIGLIRVRQTTGVDGTSAQIEVNIAWEKLAG